MREKRQKEKGEEVFINMHVTCLYTSIILDLSDMDMAGTILATWNHFIFGRASLPIYRAKSMHVLLHMLSWHTWVFSRKIADASPNSFRSSLVGTAGPISGLAVCSSFIFRVCTGNFENDYQLSKGEVQLKAT